MGFEGFSPLRKPSSSEDIPASSPDAAEVASVYNELQIQMAKRKYQEAHPNQIEPATGNEVMEEWVMDGSATRFSEEFGSFDASELREALRKIKGDDSETLH